jgi:anti-sigma factor RsiW
MSAVGCAELREASADLALGDLSGSERADALAHLAACPMCGQLVGELTRVAEDLLLLAPELEPPPGFESRVLAHLEEERRPRRLRFRSLVAVAAAVVVLAAGGGLVAQMVDDDDRPRTVRTALAISASGRSTCRVVVHGGRPASLVVSLDGPAGSNREYVVEAQPAKGAAIPVGRFALADGHGLLATTVELDADDLKSVRVFNMDGELLYEAFPEPVPGS